MNRTSILAWVAIAFSALLATPVEAQAPKPTAATAMVALANDNLTTMQTVDKMVADEKALPGKKAQLDAEAKRIAQEERLIPKEVADIKMEQDAIRNGIFKTYTDMGCKSGMKAESSLVARCDAIADKMNPQIEALNDRTKKVRTRRDEALPAAKQKLSADTLKWAEDSKRIRSRIEALEAQLVAIRARFAAACPLDINKAKPEQIKATCGNIQFDGASANLPPCATPACKQYDAMIGR